MVPIVVVLICIGWRILQRRKAEEKEENNFLTIKRLDPDESVKMNSDDESIPYKKDVTEDSPEPTEPVKVPEGAPYTYGQPYGQAPAVPYNETYDPTRQAKPYGEETEIN